MLPRLQNFMDNKGGDGYEAFHGSQSSALQQRMPIQVPGKTLNCLKAISKPHLMPPAMAGLTTPMGDPSGQVSIHGVFRVPHKWDESDAEIGQRGRFAEVSTDG